MGQRIASLLIAAVSLTVPGTSVAQDRLGDSLPEGALQRLGTTRMRSGVSDLCYLPDGRGVFAVGGRIEIWDLAEGRLQTQHQVSKGSIASVVVSKEGTALLIADNSGSVHDWDVESKETRHSWSTKQSGLCRAHFSPDEKRVLTTGAGPPTLKEWDLATGRELVAITGTMHSFREGIYGPDGKTAIVDGANGSGPLLAHYDLSDGKLLKEWLNDYYTHERSLELSSDRKRLLVGSRHKATEWLLDEYKLLGTFTGHHGHAVVSVAYCKDPNQMLTGSRDGSIRRWNRPEGEVLLRWCPHARHVTHMAVSPDGKWVLSYGNGMVAETSLETGEPRIRWDRHDEAVQAVAFLPDGQHVVSGSSDGTLRVWNTATGECLRSITGANLGAYAVAVSPDGSKAAAGCKDGVLREFDLTNGALLRELKSHLGFVRSVAYVRDGARLLSSADDGTIRVWVPDKIEPIAVLQGHRGGVLAIAVSKEGDRLLSGGRDGTVRLWDLREAKLMAILEGHLSWVGAVAFSGDGRHALSTGHDSRVVRWDLANGQIVTQMTHDRNTYALASGVNGDRAYSAGDNCGVTCWDISSGKLLKELKGHDRPVRSLSLSPDGKTIVTASDDTTLLVWDVPE
ncbi:MAG: WD40 repeat domain-containing protein [Pirellulaceae bacterium]|nr:WD40 repeat domain-containing protein [Pirellulaceae bacterium]